MRNVQAFCVGSDLTINFDCERNDHVRRVRVVSLELRVSSALVARRVFAAVQRHGRAREDEACIAVDVARVLVVHVEHAFRSHAVEGLVPRECD